MTLKRVENYLGKEGILSLKLEGFEFRHQQMDMAVAVEEAFDKANHLIVEAGTGTGKSLAYLIPAVLWAVGKQQESGHLYLYEDASSIRFSITIFLFFATSWE